MPPRRKLKLERTTLRHLTNLAAPHDKRIAPGALPELMPGVTENCSGRCQESSPAAACQTVKGFTCKGANCTRTNDTGACPPEPLSWPSLPEVRTVSVEVDPTF